MSLSKSIKSPSLILIILLGLFSGVFFQKYNNWKGAHPFSNDSDQYYCYLVGAFVHGDLNFGFENSYWLHKGPLGKPVQKMSVGVAMLETPFFLIGHFVAKLSDYKADGYSKPYAVSISVGIIVYVLIGLIFLRSVLLRWFSEFAVAMALLSVYLATNLFYYTVSFGAMSHGFVFFLFSGIIYYTVKWHENKRDRYLYLGLLFCGFATVVRPTQALMVLFPLLYGVHNLQSLKDKMTSLVKLKWKLVIASLVFVAPIFPQFLYWKIQTGSWLYFSYHKEGFFFADPKILEVLFSYRKGLIPYTPIMIFGLLGLFFMKRREVYFATWTLFLIGLYVVSSWWCWWYGGSYGMRALIDFYPIFTFSFAFIFDYLGKAKWSKIVISLCLLLFINHELNNVIRYKHVLIHWDGMSKSNYWLTFSTTKLSGKERQIWEENVQEPDYDAALEGRREVSDYIHKEGLNEKIERSYLLGKPPTGKEICSFDMEDLNDADSTDYSSGRKSIILSSKHRVYSPTYKSNGGDFLSVAGDTSSVTISADVRIQDVNSILAFVLSVERNGEKLLYKSFKVTNENLGSNNWEHVYKTFKVDVDVKESDEVACYGYIPKGEYVKLDNFKVWVQ